MNCHGQLYVIFWRCLLLVGGPQNYRCGNLSGICQPSLDTEDPMNESDSYLKKDSIDSDLFWLNVTEINEKRRLVDFLKATLFNTPRLCPHASPQASPLALRTMEWKSNSLFFFFSLFVLLLGKCDFLMCHIIDILWKIQYW